MMISWIVIALVHGCDGSSCSHSDCSNYNYHLVDLLSHNVQETRYVQVSYHCTCITTCLYHAFNSSFQWTETDSTMHTSTVIQQRDDSRSGLWRNVQCFKCTLLYEGNIAYSTVNETSLKWSRVYSWLMFVPQTLSCCLCLYHNVHGVSHHYTTAIIILKYFLLKSNRCRGDCMDVHSYWLIKVTWGMPTLPANKAHAQELQCKWLRFTQPSLHMLQ